MRKDCISDVDYSGEVVIDASTSAGDGEVLTNSAVGNVNRRTGTASEDSATTSKSLIVVERAVDEIQCACGVYRTSIAAAATTLTRNIVTERTVNNVECAAYNGRLS